MNEEVQQLHQRIENLEKELLWLRRELETKIEESSAKVEKELLIEGK